MDNLIGKELGKYKIDSIIGEGGMATVYLAQDTILDRQVAVKVIRTGRVPPEQLPRIMERFKREAKSLAKLSDDPAIVTVHDYGEYEDAPYLVMAYMPGGTLKDRLGQPMDYRKAAELLLPVTEALALAHEHGIVHRDVKPSNLLVDRKGNLALADFGIAKALEVDGQTLTGTGMGVGTPEYMAPEQWKGEASPQTDVYALGVVLYEMVTGQKPYSAGTPSEVFLKQMTQPPERPRDLVPGLPEAVEDLLDRAMDKEPAARYHSMAEFQVALEGVLKGDPIHDETPAAVEQPAIDPEQTFDELSTPSPLGEVPLPEIKTKDKVEKPQADGRGKRKWWLAGIGVIVVGGIILGVLAGGNKTASVPVEPIVTEAAVSTATLAATETQNPTQTSTVTTEPTITVTPAPTLGIGSTMISEKDGMEMVYVPAGTFIMGTSEEEIDTLLAENPDWEREYFEDEMPQHTVYLDGYWIDKYEVTNAQYAACVADGVCTEPRYITLYKNSNYQNHSVVYVSWYDAQDYCGWAGRRLPSEAEWEKAARGTDGRLYPWGNESPKETLLNYDSIEWGTTTIGSYPDGTSPYGALDMAGNVYEWVKDWYGVDYYSVSSNENPVGPSIGTYHVLRGGSWHSGKFGVRSSSRFRYDHEAWYYYDFNGIRCAISEEDIN